MATIRSMFVHLIKASATCLMIIIVSLILFQKLVPLLASFDPAIAAGLLGLSVRYLLTVRATMQNSVIGPQLTYSIAGFVLSALLALMYFQIYNLVNTPVNHPVLMTHFSNSIHSLLDSVLLCMAFAYYYDHDFPLRFNNLESA